MTINNHVSFGVAPVHPEVPKQNYFQCPICGNFYLQHSAADEMLVDYPDQFDSMHRYLSASGDEIEKKKCEYCKNYE